MRMMNRIEAIPLESMRQGMRWDWETFPEYMDSLDRQGLGVNVGCLVPFSPLRGYVLGMIPARERTSVTEGELNQMKQILFEAMQAGAFGLSADKNLEDRPEDGSWLPSHVASREEFLALSQVLSQFGVGHLGWTIGISDDQAGQRDMLAEMVRMSGRPAARGPGQRPRQLQLAECYAQRGAAGSLPGAGGAADFRVQIVGIQPVRLHAHLGAAAGWHQGRADCQAVRGRNPGWHEARRD